MTTFSRGASHALIIILAERCETERGTRVGGTLRSGEAVEMRCGGVLHAGRAAPRAGLRAGRP